MPRAQECVPHQAPPRLIFTLVGVTIALTGHAAAGERYAVVSVVTKGASLKGETSDINVTIFYIPLCLRNLPKDLEAIMGHRRDSFLKRTVLF